MKVFYFLIILFFLVSSTAYSQNSTLDSVIKKDSVPSKKSQPDTAAKKKKTYAPSPGLAATRSAIIPGWGQVYNKKYWKVPIIWGGLGATVYVFRNNIKFYKEYKQAYAARIEAQPPTLDSTNYNQLKDIYKILSPNSIRAARDEYRRYIDYSVVVFILLWGLNVVDAAVDAHLRAFDISPDLSLQFRPGYSDLAKTNGLSLVLTIGK